MKRFFARNTLKQNTTLVAAGSQRSFASSPQKNPYSNILSKLSDDWEEHQQEQQVMQH